MGVAAGGRCWPDASSALAYVCGSSYPNQQGASVYSCTASSSSTLSLSVSTVPVGCSGTCSLSVGSAVVTPSLQSCDELTWLAYYPLSLSASDGALVGGAIVGVWLIAFAWRSVRASLGGLDES